MENKINKINEKEKTIDTKEGKIMEYIKIFNNVIFRVGYLIVLNDKKAFQEIYIKFKYLSNLFENNLINEEEYFEEVNKIFK